MQELNVNRDYLQDLDLGISIVQIEAKSEHNKKFEITGSSLSKMEKLMGRFTKILQDEIPTMAIERVLVYRNDSVVDNVIIADILGKVRILVDPEDYDYVTDPEKLNNDNSIDFEIRFGCDHNRFEKIGGTKIKACYVKSDDIVSPSGVQVASGVLIAKLRALEGLYVKMKAVKGTGRDHSRFSPVYRVNLYRKVIVIPKGVYEEEADAIKAICKNDVFDIEDGALIARRPRNCNYCRNCEGVRLNYGEVLVKPSNNVYVLHVVTTGILNVDRCMTEAFKIYQEMYM